MSCVKDKIVATINDRIAKGEDLDSVAWDAVKSHLNIQRAGVKTDVEGVLKFMTDVMDSFTQSQKGGVRSYQRTIELARENLLLHGQRGDFADALVKSASSAKDLEATLLAGRVYRNQIAEEMNTLVKQARGGDAAATAKLPDLVTEALKVHSATDRLQTAAARGVSQGNIVAGKIKIDWDNVAQSAKTALADGSFDTRRFLAQLDMAGGDAASQIGLLRRFEGQSRGALNKLLSVHNEFWINGILGSITTQSANFLANTVNTVLQPLTKIVGGAVTMNPGVVKRGLRDTMSLTHTLLDVFDLTKRASSSGYDSTLTAVGKSLRNETPMLDVMFKAGEGDARHAITAENLGLQNVPVVGALVDATGAVVRWPSRVLTSADELFKQVNYRAAVRSQAFEAAEKQGLMEAGRHTELTNFVDDYMKRAFDQSGLGTNEAALLAAQQATFTQDLVGRLSKDFSNFIGKHPALRPVVPFVRTPINIMREFWQYTPGLNLLQGEFRRNLLSPDALTRGTAAGKLAIGGAATYLMYQAATNGTITGAGPAEPKQREALMATGWRPYSFVQTADDGTKTYVDYRRLDPAATLIGLVADVAEVSHHLDDPDYHGLFNAITMSVSQNITNRTYLRGIAELTTVLGSKDPNEVQKVINNRVGSYVPGYIASFNDDPYMRDIRTWTDAIRRRVPGISKTLPPRRDMFGDPVSVPVGYAIDGEPENGVPRISPFAYSKRINDPVKEELSAVAEATPGGDHGFNKPPKSMQGLDLTKFSDAKGQDAYDRYQELHGEVTIKGKSMSEALDRLIGSQYYQNLPDPKESDGRLRALQSIMAQYREEARKSLFKEFPEINDYLQTLNKVHRQQTAPSIARILNY